MGTLGGFLAERGERNKVPALLEEKSTRAAEGSAVHSCKEQSRAISANLSSTHPGDTQHNPGDGGGGTAEVLQLYVEALNLKDTLLVLSISGFCLRGARENCTSGPL